MPIFAAFIKYQNLWIGLALWYFLCFIYFLFVLALWKNMTWIHFFICNARIHESQVAHDKPVSWDKYLFKINIINKLTKIRIKIYSCEHLAHMKKHLRAGVQGVQWKKKTTNQYRIHLYIRTKLYTSLNQAWAKNMEHRIALFWRQIESVI